MAKFNVVQKRWRALIAERKRAHKGDPSTGKLKTKPQPLSVSGKRKQKLLKKWRREQKEALEKGLIAMQDLEMSVVEDTGTSQQSSMAPPPAGFSMNVKKKKGMKLKQLIRKGKGEKKNNSPKSPVAETIVDSMVE